MKVLYVSHESGLNGAPKSLLEFVTKMKDKDVWPIIIVPDRGKLKTEFDKMQIDVRIIEFSACVYHGSYGMNEYMDYYSKNFKAVRKLIQLIRNENIDLVHSNSLAVNIGAIAAYITNVPHVWHLREYLEEDFNFKLINPIICRWLLKKSECCIAISKSIMKKSKEKYGVKAVQLYNGLDRSLYYFPTLEKKNDLHEKQLLIAGHISEGKGQWDAIRAVEILVKKGIYVHLNIVGDGGRNYVSSLKRYVKKNNLEKNITFMSYTNQLQQLRLNSDAILVCSRMEAFGRVTAEAMMAGKIVIGSSSGGTLELIGGVEQRGYLYTWNKPNDLAQKIEYVLTHPEEVVEKEKRAQKFILLLTDMEMYTNKIKSIYQQLLNKNN